jgi:fucose 4-O-acetylase-like acetyltransferase
MITVQAAPRAALWDNIKAILILLVVIGHFAPIWAHTYVVIRFLYAFHMPLFVFVTGLFSRSAAADSQKQKQRTLFFLTLYVLLNLYAGLFGLLYAHNFYFSLLKNGAAGSWYLLACAVWPYARAALRKIPAGVCVPAMFVLAMLAGFDRNIGNAYSLSRIIFFFPFYLLGACADRQKIEQFSQIRRLRICAVFLLSFWLTACILFEKQLQTYHEAFFGRSAYTTPQGVLVRLCVLLLGLVLLFAVICVMPRKDCGAFTRLGARSLQIYFWHYPPLLLGSVYAWREILYKNIGNAALPLGLLFCVLFAFLLSLKPFGTPLRALQCVFEQRRESPRRKGF